MHSCKRIEGFVGLKIQSFCARKSCIQKTQLALVICRLMFQGLSCRVCGLQTPAPRAGTGISGIHSFSPIQENPSTPGKPVTVNCRAVLGPLAPTTLSTTATVMNMNMAAANATAATAAEAAGVETALCIFPQVRQGREPWRLCRYVYTS